MEYINGGYSDVREKIGKVVVRILLQEILYFYITMAYKARKYKE